MANKDLTTNRDEPAAASGESTPESRAQAKLEGLIRRHGVGPLSIEEIRSMGDLWPEDESVDDFIKAVREWRSEGAERPRP